MTKLELIKGYKDNTISIEDLNYYGYVLGMTFNEIMHVVDAKAQDLPNWDNQETSDYPYLSNDDLGIYIPAKVSFKASTQWVSTRWVR